SACPLICASRVATLNFVESPTDVLTYCPGGRCWTCIQTYCTSRGSVRPSGGFPSTPLGMGVTIGEAVTRERGTPGSVVPAPPMVTVISFWRALSGSVYLCDPLISKNALL